MLKRILTLLAIFTLCATFPSEAHAWGLYSHVAYTHSFLNTLPLIPMPLWQVMQRYPSLVMAGACLPDLAVVSRRFRASHGWGIGQQLLHTENERHLALGIGYNIHLLTDVVAHQHFVPTFEAKWNHDSLLTHAAAEWAMDAYLRHSDVPAPHRLLRLHQKTISEALSHGLRLPPQAVRQALSRLTIAEQSLRVSRLPQYLLHRYRKLDNEFEYKLAYYRDQVGLALHELPKLLNGEFPSLHAEQIHLGIEQLDAWRRKCLQDARLRPTRAIGLFEQYQHQFKQPDC